MSDTELKYGFRHDPMEWVNNDRSLEAAKVRRLVFGREIEGDQELLAEEVKKNLANEEVRQALVAEPDDGMLGIVGTWILDLLDLGCDPEQPEIKRGLDVMLIRLDALDGKAPDPEAVGSNPLRTLHRLGIGEHPTVRAWWGFYRDHVAASVADWRRGKMPWPWGFGFELGTLWIGRKVEGVEEALVDALECTRERAYQADENGATGMAFAEPWSVTLLASGVGHPIAGEIARQVLPFILRTQAPNGSWGGKFSLIAYEMLHRHGLLDALAELPPLPPDWQVVRSIRAPGPNPFNIVWDQDKLWVHDWTDDTATAVSPTDGAVLNTVKLPKGGEGGAFGAWDDSLWVLPSHTKTLSRIDPASGEVQDEISIDFPVTVFAAMVKARDKILISDQAEGGFWTLDDQGVGRYHDDPDVELACGMPDFMTAYGEQIWCWSCVWFQGMMRCDLNGRVLDWGEQPFGPDHHGIAWDGNELWAMDKKNKRICVIEKTESGQEITDALAVVEESD